MKALKLISFVFLTLCMVSASAQTIQGTILHGSSQNSVFVAIKAGGGDITGSLTDFQVTLAIPVSAVAPVPTYTANSLVTNLTLGPTAQSVTTELVGGVSSYVYTFSFAGAGVASTTYTAGMAYNIVEIFFSSPIVVTTSVQLVQLPAGGLTGQSNFFVALNNNADATNPTAPFYGTGATTDGQSYSGSSAVSIGEVVLPVKFLGFNAVKKDNNALLTWQVENESALTDRYEIERSLNGVDFKKFTTVMAKNNGLSSNTYELNDLNLSSIRSSGIFYYRIKQFDKDGRSGNSGVKSVRLTSKSLVIGVYPNPVKGKTKLTVDLEQDAKGTISITDASGKQVQTIQLNLFKGLNTKDINMSSLSSGSYMLKVQTETETKTISVVKTN